MDDQVSDYQKCQCEICNRNYTKKQQRQGVETFQGVVEVPFGQSLEIILDMLVSAKVKQPLHLSIPETFFFKQGKAQWLYYTNEKGELVRSNGPVGLKKVESVLMYRRRKEQHQEESQKQHKSPEYTSVVEKQQRQKKMKNEVAVMKILHGGYALISQFNLPFEIQKARHIDYIQAHEKQPLELIKFDYVIDRKDELFQRAHTYSLVMKGEITDWDRGFLTQEQQTLFQIDLFSQNAQKLLRYLSYKIVNIIRLTKMQILSARFDWAINSKTSAITLINVEGLEYCPVKIDPNSNKIDLKEFQEMREAKIQSKMQKLDSDQRKKFYEYNHRVNDYQKLLYKNFQIVRDKYVPFVPQLPPESESDVAFRRLHPQVKENLTDLMKDRKKFTKTMGSIFPRRNYKMDLSNSRIRPVSFFLHTPKKDTSQRLATIEKDSSIRMDSNSRMRQTFRKGLARGLKTESTQDLSDRKIEVNLKRFLNRQRW